jgi:hypothetical protein
MMSLAQFVKIAPYLENYFVLIGFIVFLVTGILSAILKNSRFSRLSRPQTMSLLLLILRYGFWLAIISIFSGLIYTGYHSNKNSSQEQLQIGPVQQQGGDCSAVQNGTGNSASVNCLDKTAGAK